MSRLPSRTSGLLALLLAAACGRVDAQAPPSASAAGSGKVVIPAEWRSVYPFAVRFPELAAPSTDAKAVDHHILDLAAFRFATDALVAGDGRGGRRFRAPDLRSFAPELVRVPFAKSGSDLFVVQAADPKRLVTLRAAFEELGADVFAYLPRHAYLARLDPSQLQTLEGRDEVFWLGLYQPAWRIAPKLDYLVETAPDLPLALTALFELESFAGSEALVEAAARAGFEVSSVTRRRGDWKVRLTGKAAGARALAALPGCLWVERFAGYRLHNNVARASGSVPTARGGAAGPLMDVEDVWARGLRGEGQIAAVSDTGLSTGDFATLHHDFGEQNSATNPLRVIKAYALGRATWDDNRTLGGGHGTHVSGSLVGNGVRSGADPQIDDYPASSYAGIAPRARLVFQSIMDSGGTLGGIPADLNDLFQPPYADGARVHSNSWGTPLAGAYNTDAQEVDEFSWNNKDMVITYTAGNQSTDESPADGVVDPDAIGAPGTAKNNLTVGASENHRPGFVYEVPEGDCTSSDGIEQRTWGWFNPTRFSTAPIADDLMADDASGLGAFSSRGPTDDGRFKPEVVAPGIAVISTRTDKFPGYEQWGVCEVPPALAPYYQTNGGTSMANPLTAGAAVLVRQYYEDGWHADGSRLTRAVPEPADGFGPSSALVKATLVNGAWDLTPGQYGAGPEQEVPPGWDTGNDLPNNAQGYGRVDLEAALFPGSGWGHQSDRMMEVHDVTPGLATGESDVYTIPVASSAGPLIVTLVWTDPYAALGAGAKLVNDLDLAVVSPSSTAYYPNGVDRTAGSADSLNNVEQTKVSSPEAGSWTITVSGSNVPGNGQPGTAVQPYALVISGVLTPPCATPAAPTGLDATPAASNRIDLSWNPVASDSYSVYRATAPGGPYQRVASGLTVTGFSDTTVSGGTTYYYVVAAVNAPGCESAYSAEASATAFGDCAAAPSFLGLTSVMPTASGGSCGLRLAWTAGASSCPGGPPVYNVYRSTTPGFTPGPASLLASCVAAELYDDTSAVAGTTYYYVVRAEDAALGGGGACRDGNADSNSIELAGTTGGDGTVLLFADDFDAGPSPADLWHLGMAVDNPYASGACAPPPEGTGPAQYADDWHRPQAGACSGNTLASNDGAADPAYSDRNDGRAILGLPPSGGPPFSDGGIVLPAAATAVTLEFDHDYDFESTSVDWDGGRLLISVDDWPNFTSIAPVGGYPGTVFNTSFFCHPWPGQPAYVADSIGCVGATFDLTAYAGQRIWLAWNHGADRFASADDGWAVDNVLLKATIPGSCSVAPSAVAFLTATATDGANEIEWLNPSTGTYGSTLIRYRTDTFPADPTDGTWLADRAGAPGAHDAVTHTGLANDTTYYYAAFVDNGGGQYSAARVVSARPFDTSGPVKWAYSTGASALAPPGIGSVYAVANDRVLHSMEPGAAGGTWPAGWTPMAMNAPAQARPPILPIALGPATKVAFVGSQDGRVYAVDADTGQQIWASPDLGGLVQAAPAGMFTAFGGAHDLILVGTRNAGGDSAFHGLHVSDGTVAWTFTNGGGASGIGIISSGATVDYPTRRVYFASRAKPGGSSNTVWCLSFDAASATLEWARDVGDVDGSPILSGGRIYVGTNAGRVYALDPASGGDLWAAPFDAADGPVKGYVWPRFGTPHLVFSTNRRVWSITDGGSAASLDWSETSIPGPSIPLAAVSDPLVWVGGGDGKLYQLDVSGASPAATSVVLGDGSAAAGSPGLDVVDGVAYLGTDAGRLYAVDVPLSAKHTATRATRSAPPPHRRTPVTSERAAGACAAVRIGSPQVLFADGFESGDLSAWAPGAPTFSATRILDLAFEVRLAPPEGDHLLRLRVRTPRGHLFQELTQPFSTEASRRSRQRAVDGFPRPLAVAAAAPAEGGGQAVTVSWPVAGTPVVHSSLYGTWTVEPYLDASTEPCGPPAAFRLVD